MCEEYQAEVHNFSVSYTKESNIFLSRLVGHYVT